MYANGGMILLKKEKETMNEDDDIEKKINLKYNDESLKKNIKCYNYLLSSKDRGWGGNIGSCLVYYKEYCDKMREIEKSYRKGMKNKNIKMLGEWFNLKSKKKIWYD